MRKLFSLVCLVISFAVPVSYATPPGAPIVRPEVKLVSIDQLAGSEKRGDELYMTVTSYPSKGRPKHEHFPKPPLHWPSKHLGSIKLSKIWGSDLLPGESITLIFTLIERDVPPWNTDDLVGEVKLKLKNESGKLLSEWSIPTRSKGGELEKSDSNSDTKVADLQGDGGHYKLKLMLVKNY